MKTNVATQMKTFVTTPTDLSGDAVVEVSGELRKLLADVFTLRTSGLSYDEIAETLRIPLGTVKSRMNALVNQLRGELQS